jgi:hypothetical protein
MTTVNETTFLLAQKYTGLLETIEEAFEHMLVCFEELRFEMAEELWAGVLLAFSQINTSNAMIADEFAESPAILKLFTQFGDVLDAVTMIEVENHITMMEQIIRDKIFPIFLRWKQQVEQELMPYYIL